MSIKAEPQVYGKGGEAETEPEDLEKETGREIREKKRVEERRNDPEQKRREMREEEKKRQEEKRREKQSGRRERESERERERERPERSEKHTNRPSYFLSPFQSGPEMTSITNSTAPSHIES
jgi:hypothetical protein